MFKTGIRNKLMGLLLAVTIIPILTSIIMSYLFTKNSVTNESIRANANLLSLGTSNIVNYMNSANQVSLRVYNSLNTPNSLFRIIQDGNNLQTDPDTFDATHGGYIGMHLLNMYQSMRDIYQIRLHIDNIDYSYFLIRGFFRGPQRNGTYRLPAGSSLSPSSPFLEATHTSHSYDLDWNSHVAPETVFTLHRPIIDTPSDRVIGSLSIDINAKALFDICKQLYVRGKENLYILDRQGSVIFADDPHLLGTRLQETWLNDIGKAGSDSGHFEWRDGRFSGIILYDTMKANYMDWLIVKEQPYSHLYATAKQITQINTTIAAVFLVIVVIATLFVSIHFTKPINRLIGYIHRIQSGNLNADNADIDIGRKDEIGILTRRFDTMIHTINDLINREYKLEIANKTNQLKALQAQINPHFMNNALQSIGTLALQHNAPKVYSLLSSLSRMMRYNMNTNEAIVPLSYEISHVKAYLELQQQRYANKLDVHYAIAPATEPVEIPKMLLQPLVENYFKHGYNPSSGSGEIRIVSFLDDGGRLCIMVEDNGTGMDPERLKQLQLQLDRPPGAAADESGRIGLNNVLLRLRLYFGDNAGIGVENVVPHGFRITLWIPVGPGQGGDTE